MDVRRLGFVASIGVGAFVGGAVAVASPALMLLAMLAENFLKLQVPSFMDVAGSIIVGVFMVPFALIMMVPAVAVVAPVADRFLPEGRIPLVICILCGALISQVAVDYLNYLKNGTYYPTECEAGCAGDPYWFGAAYGGLISMVFCIARAHFRKEGLEE